MWLECVSPLKLGHVASVATVVSFLPPSPPLLPLLLFPLPSLVSSGGVSLVALVGLELM